MTELLDQAKTLYAAGDSMKTIAQKLDMSAAWVCKNFKRLGIKARPEHSNSTSFSAAHSEYLIANADKPYVELAAHIGKTAQSVSQWMQKRGFKKKPSPKDRKLPERECLHCKAVYKPKQSPQMYCSTQCMGDAKRLHQPQTCIQCGTEFTPGSEHRKFCSVECAQEGFQKQHIKVRPYPYNGINMRSTWEVKFAQWLDSKGLEWKYEPKFFAMENRKRYCPDFYVPAHDAYYEIKGWMKQEAADKIRQFRELYSHESLIVVNKDAFKLYGVKL